MGVKGTVISSRHKPNPFQMNSASWDYHFFAKLAEYPWEP